MNVNRLYIAQIYVCSNVEIGNTDFFLGIVEREFTGIFCKNTIVYHTKNNNYVDLFSNEKYILGFEKVSKIGQMYINLKYGFKPLNQFFDVDFKKENMSRKRIIRTLSKSKLLDKKEDDK